MEAGARSGGEARSPRSARALRSSVAALLCGVLLVPLLAAPARAQVPPVQEQERPAEGVREAERAARASEAAKQLRPLAPGEKVTYEDVLRHPDDVELNYLYAQSQVAAGELRGAASTLERVLILAPDLARVRLLYAVVLFRLDNLSEAEREFEAVSQLPMTDSLRDEVDQYLQLIAFRRKTTRMGGALSLGAQWDSNRNAGPLSDQVLFFDFPLNLVTGRSQGDFSGVGIAGFQVEHDLGYEEGHLLTGAAQVYGQKQSDLDNLDLMALSVEGGGLYRAGFVDVQPQIFGSYLNLAGESYVSTIGTGLGASRRLTPALLLSGSVRADYEFFEPLTRSPITNQRTGFRVAAGVNAAWTPRPWVRLDLGAAFLDKEARQDYFAFRGPLAAVGATWLPGHGQFLLSSFSFQYDGYLGPERVVSFKRRRDEWYRGRVGYGAPLGFLLRFLAPPKAVRDTVVTVNGEYLNVQSNITNYQYDNWRFTVLFTRSFDF